MNTCTIPIREDVQTVYLEAYMLKNSPEFQTDRRRPAVIVCPGGAYMATSDREAEPVALRFLAQGYHAFVLRYSVQTQFPQPMLDLARALLLVRAQAAEWLLDPNQVAVCGFSAGGHLAASLGVLWNHPFLYEPLGVRPEQIRPDALILGYPAIDLELAANPPVQVDPQRAPIGLNELVLTTVFGEYPPPRELVEQYRADRHVTSDTPPTFIWHTADDELVSARNALRFAAALAEHNVPYELHVFESGLHGLALADETTDVDGRFVNPDVQIWLDLALAWLKRRREPPRPKPDLASIFGTQERR
jgi:acetyl esterase/lipase